MVPVSIVAPPVYQLIIIHQPVICRPVKLRHHIVYPALLHPFARIGIKLIISFKAVRIRTIRVMALICPYAKRTDAELYIIFMIVDTVAKHLDQLVNIIAAPVVNILKIACKRVKGLLVVYLLAFNFIGIKIIVHMHAVDIIIVHHGQNYLYYIVAHFRYTRIKQFYPPVSKKPAGLQVSDVVGAQAPEITIKGSPVRVKPGMQLHTAFVAFGYRELQRVPKWVRRLALFAGKPSRPWLYPFCI